MLLKACVSFHRCQRYLWASKQPPVASHSLREGRSDAFSLIWARLHARPKILRAWLTETRKQVAAERAARPHGTGCDEDDALGGGAADTEGEAVGFARLQVMCRNAWMTLALRGHLQSMLDLPAVLMLARPAFSRMACRGNAHGAHPAKACFLASLLDSQHIIHTAPPCHRTRSVSCVQPFPQKLLGQRFLRAPYPTQLAA